MYEGAWALAAPLLRGHLRMKDGYAQRRLEESLPSADIWIQAASGGEAYLAWTLLSNLRVPFPVTVLVTTNTRQGMDVTERAVKALGTVNPDITIHSAWFPFDRPSIMRAAANQVDPKLAVILETELWPGFLSALKNRGCPIFIVNGRMTEKSAAGYTRFPKICRLLAPDRILAMSNADAQRFKRVFGRKGVSVIPNIKFDRLVTDITSSGNGGVYGERPGGFVNRWLPPDARFLVLGSIRREEEKKVARIIEKVHHACPDVIIGVFPRHIERADYWEKILKAKDRRYRRRSGLKESVRPGDILLWDVFGELSEAYGAAHAVFVGGSLAPLGGQNFLEPLVYGAVPVIGPSYDNFAWVGEEIFSAGLAIRAANAREAAGHLIRQLTAPLPGPKIAAAARQYITARQGGARMACDEIENAIREKVRPGIRR